MVKEWISLVVERDRLLREQLDKVHTHNTYACLPLPPVLSQITKVYIEQAIG